MQNIELYIEGQRLDLFEDESVSLTQTIKNARDVAKVFTDFTQTFNVPASKTNNKIFKHYYNFDIVDGFDARIKVAGTIELNSFPFKDGKIKLEGVKLKENQAYSYKITFFGNTVNLKDLLGEDKLNQLDSLNSLSLDYDSAKVKEKLQVDPTTVDIIAPLITHTKRLYYKSSANTSSDGNLWYHSGSGQVHEHGVLYSDLKYALRVHNIVQAITVRYPSLVFSNDFFSSSNLPYYKLFMWLHRKKGDVESGTGASFVNSINGWTPAVGEKSSMINNSTFRITDSSNSQFLTLILNRGTGGGYAPYSIQITRDGQVIYSDSDIIVGTEVIALHSFINQGSDYTVTITYGVEIVFNTITWDYQYNTQGGPDIDTFPTGGYTAPESFEFAITQQIPDIKIIDVLTGLFKMFNLVAFTNDLGVIVVKTLDSFYTGGSNYDISQYIDVNSSGVNVALPYKEIVFDYKDKKTFLNAIHSPLLSYTWAKLEYNGGENLDGGVYKIEIPFGHFKFERIVDANTTAQTDIQWGYCVDDNQEPYIGAPFIFYPIKITDGTEISFRDDATNHSAINDYIVPSNSLALEESTSKDNINFKAEFNEYTGSSGFTDTLFEKYYSNYIGNIFNSKNRLTKVTAYLPLKILLNFTLADRFDINGQRYKINSIKTNLKTGKSDIELLNELW